MQKYILQCGQWESIILPELGCNLISLKYKNQPILRSGQCDEDVLKSPILHGFPLLLPANRTRDGKFTFQGKEYSLPVNETARGCALHGRFFNAPFEILRYETNRLISRFQNRNSERYPFDLDITIDDQLSDSGHIRKITVTAMEDLPYTLGFHTNFYQPKAFFVPRDEEYVMDERKLPTGRMIPAPPLVGAFDSCCTSPAEEREKNGFSRAEIDSYYFTVSKEFDHWIVFNFDGKQDYVSVEPQAGRVNGLNCPDGHRVLLNGQSEHFLLSITTK